MGFHIQFLETLNLAKPSTFKKSASRRIFCLEKVNLCLVITSPDQSMSANPALLVSTNELFFKTIYPIFLFFFPWKSCQPPEIRTLFGILLKTVYLNCNSLIPVKRFASWTGFFFASHYSWFLSLHVHVLRGNISETSSSTCPN